MGRKRSGKKHFRSSRERTLAALQTRKVQRESERAVVQSVPDVAIKEPVAESQEHAVDLARERAVQDIVRFGALPPALQQLTLETRDLRQAPKGSALHNEIVHESYTIDDVADAIVIGIRRQNPNVEELFAASMQRRK